jgi:hypothetical protein
VRKSEKLPLWLTIASAITVLVRLRRREYMSDGLGTMVHFYNDDEFLFRTVTMCPHEERERIFDRLVEAGSWYYGRYSKSERDAYMLQRTTVEDLMHSEFEKRFWPTPGKVPVYFYIYPHLDVKELQAKLDRRKQLGEASTRFLLFRLVGLPSTRFISFTLQDSLQSYRHILQDRRIPVRETPLKLRCAQCQGRIFPIDELKRIHAKHCGEPELYFEVQVWDPTILPLMPGTR